MVGDWFSHRYIAGFIFGIFIVYEPGFLTEPVDPSQYTTPLFILQILFITGKSSVVEEIIFRGLLFGYLVKQSGNEKQSLLIQAVLFWLLHFHYLWLSPFSFWFGIPVSTLIFSMLVWRSRSLSSAIMAHVLSNTFVTIFAIAIANS